GTLTVLPKATAGSGSGSNDTRLRVGRRRCHALSGRFHFNFIFDISETDMQSSVIASPDISNLGAAPPWQPRCEKYSITCETTEVCRDGISQISLPSHRQRCRA